MGEEKRKYTGGPWEIREVAHEKSPWRPRRVYRVEIIAPQYLYGKRTHSRDICQMVDYCEWTDHPANARLIAAAPELLEALELAINTVECASLDRDGVTELPWYRAARAALAKVRGWEPA